LVKILLETSEELAAAMSSIKEINNTQSSVNKGCLYKNMYFGRSKLKSGYGANIERRVRCHKRQYMEEFAREKGGACWRVAEPLWKNFLGHNISGREIGWCGWLSEKSPKCVAVTAVVVKGDENRQKKCQK
jgi:hypothetical protein